MILHPSLRHQPDSMIGGIEHMSSKIKKAVAISFFVIASVLPVSCIHAQQIKITDCDAFFTAVKWDEYDKCMDRFYKQKDANEQILAHLRTMGLKIGSEFKAWELIAFYMKHDPEAMRTIQNAIRNKEEWAIFAVGYLDEKKIKIHKKLLLDFLGSEACSDTYCQQTILYALYNSYGKAPFVKIADDPRYGETVRSFAKDMLKRESK